MFRGCLEMLNLSDRTIFGVCRYKHLGKLLGVEAGLTFGWIASLRPQRRPPHTTWQPSWRNPTGCGHPDAVR